MCALCDRLLTLNDTNRQIKRYHDVLGHLLNKTFRLNNKQTTFFKTQNFVFLNFFAKFTRRTLGALNLRHIFEF